MISSFVMNMNLGYFQAAAFVIFATIYVVMLTWIFRRNSKSHYSKIAAGILDQTKQENCRE